MLFSMLANLAEDRQGVEAEHEATVAAAIEKLKADGIDGEAIAALLSASPVAPVLIAHQTEERRKSVLDHKRSEEHTYELESLMRISTALFCLKITKESESQTCHN